MRVCIYEDRPSDIIGVKLLVASLGRHCKGLEVEVTAPGIGESEKAWFLRRPWVCLREECLPGVNGYNVKPTVLLRALHEGCAEAVWVDSDIIVTADLRPLLANHPGDAVVAAQEWFGAPYPGGSMRTEGWGLEVARCLPFTVNTAVLRVRNIHIDLLQEWDALLRTEAYRKAQSQDWSKRPIWLMGDQEVLTALLGCRDFAHVPLGWIRRGSDIAHCFPYPATGYVAHERILNLLKGRLPVFVHSIVQRPWRPPEGKMTLHLDLSPYTIIASDYEQDVEERLDWTKATTMRGKLLRAITLGHPTAAGLLPAVTAELMHQRIAKASVRGLIRRTLT